MSQLDARFLGAIRLRRERVKNFRDYPFCIPVIKKLKRIEFDPAVTFLVGENGVGKSTLLEAIAVKMGFNAEGGSKNFCFTSVACVGFRAGSSAESVILFAIVRFSRKVRIAGKRGTTSVGRL